nr:hypothetical protein [Tanacetum cinerariifolium]
MVDNSTMEEMLQAPTEGYGDAIVVLDILAENFEIKTSLLSLIQANQFHGFESNNPHDHISSFNRITSTLNGWKSFEKDPRDALTIIENKSKVCYSRNKPVAFKVSTTSSGNSSSTDARIDKLTDTISNLVETFNKKMTIPATVKAVEETCVICEGPHPYYDCIATDSNISSACPTTGTYNQGNTRFRPQVATNYYASLPDFPPVQNNQNRFQGYNKNQGNNQGNYQNRGRRGNNFNQASTYQAPTHQPQVVTQSYFQAYMKANDAVLKYMQTQMTSLTNSNIKLKSMFGQFMKMNTASSSGSGSLPSNIVPNPWGDLKAITTRSGVTLVGPSVSPPPPPSKEVDREPKTITDQVLTESTNNVPPLVVQPSPASTTSTPISSPKIPKNLHFELSFENALLHMPKFALMFKSILNNKEKLFDLATNLVNENCSAVILKKLPEKLGDPGKFLISCDFPELNECLALADLGASINLMPLSIWRKLSLPELTFTQMILELVDRSTTRPAGIAEDIFVKVGKFHFLTDFVVVDYVIDPRVPLILGRPFLRTGRALIDVYSEELTLHIDAEAITFKVGQTLKYSYNDAESINQIDVINVTFEEYVQEVLGFSDNS